MAQRSPLADDELMCPVCCDVFRDPVILSCSHSFCKSCLVEYWKTRPTRECPMCRRRSSKVNPPANLALKNLCEALSQKKYQTASESELLCSQHGERLKLFCLEDKKPVCLVCMHSDKHAGHKFRPIDEAARDFKVDIKSALKPLERDLMSYNDVKQSCNQIMKHITIQTQHSEKMIRAAFQKLRISLEKEEKARIMALREDAEEKCQIVNRQMKDLSEDISALSDTIQVSKEAVRMQDTVFLQKYQSIATRIERKLPEPKLSFQLLDVASHVGNLGANVLEKLKDTVEYTPLILDPNTAHPSLVVSDDLTSVMSTGERQELPDNPERFDTWPAVVGSKALGSGKHKWDIEVGDCTDWGVGVLVQSKERKGTIRGGYWMLGFRDGKYYVRSVDGRVSAKPEIKNTKKIRVELDCDEKELTFFNVRRWLSFLNDPLHTFSCNYSGKVFPFIYGNLSSPLKILPIQKPSRSICSTQ